MQISNDRIAFSLQFGAQSLMCAEWLTTSATVAKSVPQRCSLGCVQQHSAAQSLEVGEEISSMVFVAVVHGQGRCDYRYHPHFLRFHVLHQNHVMDYYTWRLSLLLSLSRSNSPRLLVTILFLSSPRLAPFFLPSSSPSRSSLHFRYIFCASGSLPAILASELARP